MKLHCTFRVMMQAISPSPPKKKKEQEHEKRNVIFFRRYEGM